MEKSKQEQINLFTLLSMQKDTIDAYKMITQLTEMIRHLHIKLDDATKKISELHEMIDKTNNNIDNNIDNVAVDN